MSRTFFISLLMSLIKGIGHRELRIICHSGWVSEESWPDTSGKYGSLVFSFKANVKYGLALVNACL